jgi:hypothetical protein
MSFLESGNDPEYLVLGISARLTRHGDIGRLLG